MGSDYMNDKIQDNLKPLYSCYAQYKMLFEFYMQNKKVRSKEEVEERIEYLKKNKINQRTELETLLWFINGVSDEED